MRILLTSDLHYKLRQYDWLIGAAAGFDVVVIAGDHIDAFLPVPSGVQIAALSASLTAVAQRSRVLACSGNHTARPVWGRVSRRISRRPRMARIRVGIRLLSAAILLAGATSASAPTTRY